MGGIGFIVTVENTDACYDVWRGSRGLLLQ